MKPDSSPISSQAMISRMSALLSGEAKPETETDRIWVQEMDEILSAGGEIAVPTDLPDPMSAEDAKWHLSDSEGIDEKSGRRFRFDWYGRDGDLDGQVQDGTPFARRSRSNSHNAISKGKRKLVQRLRLRDMPFPFAPEAPPADAPPVAAQPDRKSLLTSIGRSRARGAGRSMYRRSARYKPDAVDGNGNGIVQEGTPFERPDTPNKPNKPNLPGSGDMMPEPWRGHPASPRRPSKPQPTRMPSDYADLFPDDVVNAPALPKRRESSTRQRSILRRRSQTPRQESRMSSPTAQGSGSTSSSGGFTALGRYDGIRSPRIFGNQKTMEELHDIVREAQKKGDGRMISQYLQAVLPFGGHRSREDGAHPAAKGLVEDFKARTQKKYGSLATIEDMEAALAQAFPGAEISLQEIFLQGEGWLPTSPSDAQHSETINWASMLASEFGVDYAEGKYMHQYISRAVTQSLLALAEDDPETAKHVSRIGFTGGVKMKGTMAFVAGDKSKAGRSVVMANPVQLAKTWLAQDSEEDIINLDYSLAAISTMVIKAKGDQFAATSLGGVVSDSDIDATIMTTMVHEWGHLTGNRVIVDKVLPELGGLEGLREMVTGTDPINPMNYSAQVEDFLKALKKNRPQFQGAVTSGAEELAKHPSDLAERLLRMGITPPPNLDTMPLAQRELLARKVMEEAVMAMSLRFLEAAVAEGDGPWEARGPNNMPIRSLGTYAWTNTEEASAELYLAARLGLKLEEFINKFDDRNIYDRVRSYGA